MKTKQKVILSVVASLVAATLAAVVLCWDAVVMCIAPQIPLGAALRSAAAELEEMYQESPLPIILRGYDEDGRNTAQIDLFSSEGKGTLLVQTDLAAHQILAEGTLPEELKLGTISLYLDQNFAALTSDTLLQGGYYGITYETFGDDLRSIPLVSLLVPQDTMRQMEEDVSSLQKSMARSINLPRIPDISMEDLKPIPLALWLLRGRVSVQDLEVHGQLLPCYRIVYRVEGKTVQFLREKVFNGAIPEDSRLQLTFYMHQKSLVRLDAEVEGGDRKLSGSLTMAEESGDLALSITPPEGTIMAFYREGEWNTICLGDPMLSYQWVPQTGDLVLKLPEEDAVSFNLKPAENGFCIQSAQLGSLMKSRLLSDYPATVTVSRGSNIQMPAFKNLNQWSFEDLLIFLNGVWKLLKP